MAGQDISQAIARESHNYTFVVTVTADNAQSAEAHQAMTASTGFTNVLSDTEGSYNVPSTAPVCNVYVKNVVWDKYEEESDWQGPMLATYSGEVSAETSCEDVKATISIRAEGGSSYLNKTEITLDKIDMYDYTFTTVLVAPNEYGYYYGKLNAYDANNEADKDHGQTEEHLWDPPCYLEIDNFEQLDQVSSVDQLRTQLTYTVAVSEHGDNACRDNHLSIVMENSDGKTFQHWFDENDREKALQPNGFNYTVAIETASATDAKMHWKDERAVENQTAKASGWVEPPGYDCSVNIVDFCLINAQPLNDTRWEFNFTIRAMSNSKCGALTTWMDIIWDEYTFLGGVEIPNNTIVDSFNCDCVKTFAVQADFDGSPGDVYGQLDVRNAQNQVVQIQDSCVKSVPM